ncbi:unnamed protein product [Brassica oleracea var. botrytis]|uniref:Fucosyltransferase n=1 Tax=Brassica oleracea TaxID=3712 RepID=A0A3P6GQX7_BRAOL|nr:unnamed protein product [Brassica oleracea]
MKRAIISGMMKLTMGIATCLLLLFCLVLLKQSSNIFNHHKSVFTAELDEDSCLSRYQSSLYRKTSPYKPSQHLISKLRRYEKLHKRCGPGTEAYKSATDNLGHNHVSNSGDECRYVLCVSPLSGLGLGNRMISMVSMFLYALLTERIMLVDQRIDTSDLFCEPFPGTSWFLPLDSPLMDQLDSFNREYSRCYGTMLKNHCINSTTIPSQLYLYLFHDYGDHDQMFFCEDKQIIIGKVPWLVAKSNQYFVPSLRLIPSFQTKLIKLFPQKDTVFHHLSRYLLHPTNQVWGMVTRSYTAYLSRADERLGIQIVACTQREKLLPEVDTHEQVPTTEKTSKLKAVLFTSQVKKRISRVTRSCTTKRPLSMTDEVVISASSTFGYVAQGMGGLKSWILYEPVNHTGPDPPCGRAISMEPCFHVPPVYGCNGKTGTNTGNIVPFVRHCEDRILGIKLVQDTS